MQRHSRRAGRALAVFAGLTVACGGGSSPSAPTRGATSPGDATPIAITGSSGPQSFDPNPAAIVAGRRVVWQNRDSVTHHIVQDGAGDPGDPGYGGAGSATGGFDAGETAPGATSAAFTTTTMGVIRYHCTIHPSMVGTLHVVP